MNYAPRIIRVKTKLLVRKLYFSRKQVGLNCIIHSINCFSVFFHNIPVLGLVKCPLPADTLPFGLGVLDERVGIVSIEEVISLVGKGVLGLIAREFWFSDLLANRAKVVAAELRLVCAVGVVIVFFC